MGGIDPQALAWGEPTVKYHPALCDALTERDISHARTVAGGQFDWGGRLRKGSGGAQRFPQVEWKPTGECTGTRELDCEPDKASRDESRAE